MKKKFRIIYGIVGFLIGFFLHLTIWSLYLIDVSDAGFAIPAILITSIFFAIACLFISLSLIIGKKYLIIFSFIGFLTPLIILFLKWQIYSNLPSIEQRGFGSTYINWVFTGMITTIVGFIIGYILSSWRKW